MPLFDDSPGRPGEGPAQALGPGKHFLRCYGQNISSDQFFITPGGGAEGATHKRRPTQKEKLINLFLETFLRLQCF